MLWDTWAATRVWPGLRPFSFFAAARCRERVELTAWRDYVALCLQLSPQLKYPTTSWQRIKTPMPEVKAGEVLRHLEESGAIEIRKEVDDESA